MSTRAPHVRDDRRFVAQIRASIRSACNLTSEGFYRKRDGDFINYLIMARASIGEASDQIDDGLESGYLTEQQRNEMIVLVKRAMKANSSLRRYLESRRQKPMRRSQGPKDPRTGGPKDPRT